MRLVALLTCLTLLGCFPNNPKHRTYAQIVEGAMLAGGVAILAVSNTGADCDMTVKLGMPKEDCKSTASLLSGIGLALVVGGLVGFMATIATIDSKSPQVGQTKTDQTKTDKTVTPKPEAPSLTPTPIVTPPAPTPTPAPTPAPTP
jgi:hypothetical protein